MALSVLSLFVLTGYAVIIYLNQDDPQPRERDYSYVGSFLAFSVWIGVGTAMIGERIQMWIQQKELANRLVAVALILQILFIPGVILSSNYHSHDRSGNYVAWDYSYNILQSVGPNGVLFTNGDNDTFPLWYLQEVEEIRKDVAVVNLSLLNTAWYIKQLAGSRPDSTSYIRLSHKIIDKITSNLQRWEEQKVRVSAPNDPENPDGFIEWNIKPTFAGQALRVQDMMILRIINDAKWRVPIYFAVTVSQSNRIGLDNYLDMQGLTFQLKSHKTRAVDAEKMYTNLMTSVGPDEWSKEFSPKNFNREEDLDYLNWSREYQPGYMFRNLGNDEVYFNDQIIRLLQNYRSAYMQLAVTYYLDHQKETRKKDSNEGVLNDLREKTLLVLDQMRINIPESTIMVTAEDLHYQVARLYGDLDRKETMKQIMDELTSTPIGRPGNRVEYANVYYKQLSDTSKALSILENLQSEFLQLESMIKVKGFGQKTVSTNQWKRWQQAYPDIVSSLVYIYRVAGLDLEAESVLNDWVERYPNDKNAKNLLDEVRDSG
tara:strand:- start:2112 stop:3743 length:1632 start_codon:yes stop_codon:yes gene_type:complete